MAACRTACFHGPIRKSDTEIGFGPRGTLESVCALLCDRPVIINELRYSAVSRLVRVVIVCRSCRCPVDRFGDQASRLDLARSRVLWLLLYWPVWFREPQDSAVSGLMGIASVCRIACFRGSVRESDTEIGFGPRGTLESVCALLRDRPVIINEP